jgi:hypothetical protein
MEDAVDAPERPIDDLAVAQVADEQLRLGGEVVGGTGWVGEPVEVVQYTYRFARFEEQVYEVGADETGATGDEDAVHQTV